MNQISLSIPFQLNLKLEKPLYFRYEKVDCGLISQIAIKEGLHPVTAVHKYDLIHEISTEKGQNFQVSLEGKKGGYNVVGLAEHLPEKYVLNDTRIDSVTDSGKSLRKAQIGATYSLLAHWSLSKEAATIVLPTGTGKTETMLVSVLADRASKVLVIV